VCLELHSITILRINKIFILNTIWQAHGTSLGIRALVWELWSKNKLTFQYDGQRKQSKRCEVEHETIVEKTIWEVEAQIWHHQKGVPTKLGWTKGIFLLTRPWRLWRSWTTYISYVHFGPNSHPITNESWLHQVGQDSQGRIIKGNWVQAWKTKVFCWFTQSKGSRGLTF